jgi:predicted ester cyclase
MKVALALLAVLADVAVTTAPAATPLISPDVIVADAELSKLEVDALTLAPRRYDTFWNTGDERLAKAALSQNFIDHTLPQGRAQGPEGPLAASRAFRAAVPDLSCEVEQMIVAGDRVTAFLHFRGHFSGTFNAREGQGQAVDFIAIDIYRVTHSVIADDWHLEDNLTLLRQLGVVAP